MHNQSGFLSAIDFRLGWVHWDPQGEGSCVEVNSFPSPGVSCGLSINGPDEGEWMSVIGQLKPDANGTVVTEIQ